MASSIFGSPLLRSSQVFVNSTFFAATAAARSLAFAAALVAADVAAA